MNIRSGFWFRKLFPVEYAGICNEKSTCSCALRFWMSFVTNFQINMKILLFGICTIFNFHD